MEKGQVLQRMFQSSKLVSEITWKKPTQFSALTTEYPSSQLFKSVCRKRGRPKPYVLQGAASVLPQSIAFHLNSPTRSVWKSRPPSARGRRGKDELHIGYIGVENHGFLLFRAWGVLSKAMQVGAPLSSFPVEASVQEQQCGSCGRQAELCARALQLMNWKHY